ncbi:hypothetical protein QBC34DRAFT_314073, partial [Podospora aff. communis PSN243]
SNASDSQGRGSGGRRTRSSSPVKNADELLRLRKPVVWTNGPASRLFDQIWSAIQGEGYLPVELQPVLQSELMVAGSRFGRQRHAALPSGRDKADLLALLPPLAAEDHDEVARRVALHGELREIRHLVDTTAQFINTPRSEAAWNDHIHGPLLRLAVAGVPAVVAENITQASIAKPFVPATAHGELEVSSIGGKTIDYALVLQPNQRLAARIVDFVNGLDSGEPRTFNQSTSPALCYRLTGVFIETKVDMRWRAEAKVQLGIWLASWFSRVATFPSPPPRTGVAGTPRLPFLPVLLVVCESWELYFAFDREADFEVCGPLEIGGTKTVEGTYRLLQVLRLLAEWVAGEFCQWVESCVLYQGDAAL